MEIKRFINKYLYFNTSQKAGIAILLLIIASLIFVPEFVFKIINKKRKVDISSSLIDSIDNTIEKTKYDKNNYKSSLQNKYSPFFFDPNTVNPDELKMFGLPEWVICNFTKYRNSGAKFKNPNDFSKIYGLKPEIFKKIEPYIKIKTDSNISKHSDYIKKIEIIEKKLIEINSADSVELIKVKGIGPFLASKIIKYRNALGGFINTNQLYEIYNIKKEIIDAFILEIYCDASLIKKISINTAFEDELKNHPYLSWKEANAIVKFRKQNGMFKNIMDLKKIILLKPETIDKIEQYLEF